MRVRVMTGLAGIAMVAILWAVVSLVRSSQPAGMLAATPTAMVTERVLSRTVTATGTVRPVTGAEIKVGAQVAGELTEVPVKAGDRIAKGALLARIDSATFLAKTGQAEAALRQAEVERDYARIDFGRKNQLQQAGAASAQALDTARFTLAAAEAKYQGAAAVLEQARLDLGHTTVTAPIGGVVAEVSVRQGETLAMRLEMPSLVTIIDTGRLEVRTYVDETDIGRIQPGQKASFTVDTYPDREIPATVRAIEPKPRVENGVVSYIAVLDFIPPDGAVIRPEMTAHVKLVISEAAAALTIPRTALRRDGSREFVRLRQGDAWIERTVVTGWRDESSVEIRDGLAAGDAVQLNTL